jgi:hypothetical protein
MPKKYAVPVGSACSRLLSACAARYTGCAVRERERLDGLDTHSASQTSGRFCYSIGKTRVVCAFALCQVIPSEDCPKRGRPTSPVKSSFFQNFSVSKKASEKVYLSGGLPL